MTAATHRAIKDITARLVIGALVLVALLLMGLGMMKATGQSASPWQ